MIKTLLTVATYNEALNLIPLLKRLSAVQFGFDVLIIDDNSPDGTGALADRLAMDYSFVKVLHRARKTGLSAALVEGFGWALQQNYDSIVNLDGDLSHRPEDLASLVSDETSDIVIGSRYLSGTRAAQWAWRRLMLSRAAGGYIRGVTGLRLTDPTSGFRVYRQHCLRDLVNAPLRSNGYSIHFEMTHIGWRKGLKIREVPITFVGRVNGESKLNARIIWEALWLVLRLRLTSNARSNACVLEHFEPKEGRLCIMRGNHDENDNNLCPRST